MAKNKKDPKRPPWYRPFARAKYDAMKTAYNEFKARVLPAEEAETYDVELPPSWGSKTLGWLFGRKRNKTPPGSGVGLVQAPFADIYTRTYGVDPISDLPKYRTMYRNNPDIQEAIELQVNLAIGKGFNIDHPVKEVEEYLTQLADDINLKLTMLVLAKDCLIYGNAYGEILWDNTEKKMEEVYQVKNTYFTASEVKKLRLGLQAKPVFVADEIGNPSRRLVGQVITKGKGKAKRILGIKPLDPVYMRVRRDSYGNVYGYIQKMTTPPVFLDTDNIIHIKYRPTSTGYESAYGQSILMPLIKNQDLLDQFENDAAIWIHSRAIPPLIVRGGSSERPYTTSEMKALMKKLATRTAASMIFVKGDVQIDELVGVARNMNINWWLNYLLTRRFQALGVPKVLMGIPEGTNRATGEVIFQDFITRLQLLQHFIGDAIETQVFYPLIKSKFGDTYTDQKGNTHPMPKARILWKPIVEEDRNMRAQRLIQALQAGAISINEFRTKIGFPKLDESYDMVRGQPVKPPKIPKGFTTGLPEFARPPPEGVPKRESLLTPEQEFRVKKLRLLVSQEQFKNELLRLVEQAKFEFRQGDRLVRDIKKEMLDKAKVIIDKYVKDAYLYGKLDSSSPTKLEDLTLKKEDLAGVAKLKKKFVRDFRKILTDMVKAKSKGLL